MTLRMIPLASATALAFGMSGCGGGMSSLTSLTSGVGGTVGNIIADEPDLHIPLRGLTATFRKKATLAVPVAGVPDAFEDQSADFASDDLPFGGVEQVTASLKIPVKPSVIDKATLTGAGGAPSTQGGVSVSETNGTDGDRETSIVVTLLQSAEFVGDRFDVESTDVDHDDRDDFFAVDHHVGGGDARRAEETISLYYGGDFAAAAAVAALGAQATFRRSASGDNAGLVRASRGDGLANADFAISNGDVEIVADFNAGVVNGSITNLGAIAGAGPRDFDVLLENAAINGVHYDGGTARLVAAGTADTLGSTTTSGFIGSFMGPNAERTSGVFQIVGAVNGEASHVSGRFTADKQ